MHDPFPFSSPGWLSNAVAPLASKLSLPTLPLHIHEVLVAFTLYNAIQMRVSPWISRKLFPDIYNALNRRTRLSWDVHVVSLVQSLIICALALWVSFKDPERKAMDWRERVWGYTGAVGLVQAFAAGYFLWDLILCALHIDVFGPGMLAHAISAISVFSLGFRPFVNFYGPTFILYELSSPFLNIHWFCDKLNLTGSSIQFYNGILLIATFLCCRIIWGSYQSISVFYDVFRAYREGYITPAFPDLPAATNGTMSADPKAELMAYAENSELPLWLVASYLSANVTLNALNWYWFEKMIATIRKRFDPPFGTKGVEEKKAAAKKEKAKADSGWDEQGDEVARGINANGTKTVEVHRVEKTSTRNRRRG